MIRNSLAANDQYALECITPSNGSAFQYRTTSGGGAGGTGGDSGPAVPYWVKLVCSSNTITGYRSPDGSTWTQDGSVSITMGSTVYVGLEADSNWNTYAKLIDNAPRFDARNQHGDLQQRCRDNVHIAAADGSHGGFRVAQSRDRHDDEPLGPGR